MCVGKMNNNNQLLEFRRERTSKKSDIKKKVKIVNEVGKIQYQEDILAVSTYYVKKILFSVGDFIKWFQCTKYYQILSHTTQPAHVITALSVIFISYLMFPTNQNRISSISPLWTMLYLGAFTTHFGSQMWMTFVAGLALYFSLPRHIFGNVQKILFPKYFFLNATLSLITLTIFVKINKAQLATTEIAIQAFAMTLCFLIELIVRLYWTPPLIHLITVKTKIEADAKVGMEIGKLNAGNLLNCPHYLKVHRAFRRVHMTIAMGNLTSIACTVLHLYYLSHKMCDI